ncbi:MAG: DUF1285 domain-containing protein [Maricaulaceae bacterium]
MPHRHNDLSSYTDGFAAAARSAGDQLPPVETWNPPYCGDIGLEIRADGRWWAGGTPFTRDALVRLFARILRKDADGRHYLVTPVEKVDVAVEIAPFLAVRLDVQGAGEQAQLAFVTNLGDGVSVDADHPLWIETDQVRGDPRPLVRVRGRLDALLTRSVFFDLAQHAVDDPVRGWGVWSSGAFWPLSARGAGS